MRKELVVILGIVMGSFLLTVSDVYAWGRVCTAVSNLRVRTGPGLEYDKVGLLLKGDKVKLDFVDGEWGAVFHIDAPVRDISTALGFCNINYLKRVASSQKKSQVIKTLDEVRYATRDLDVRVRPSEYAQKLVTVPQGEAVKVNCENGPWCLVYPLGTKIDDVKMALGYALETEFSRSPVASPHEKVVEATENVTAEEYSVNIVAKKMAFLNDASTLVFEGSAEAYVSDIIILSDKMVAHRDTKNLEILDNFKRIVANGHVHFVGDTIQGKCASLTYDADKTYLYMEGNPKLEHNQKTFSGKTILVDLTRKQFETINEQGETMRMKYGD